MDSVSVRVLEVLEGSIGTCPYPQAHTVPTIPTMHIIFLLQSLKNFFFLLQLENPTLEPPAGQQELCLNYLPASQSSGCNECLLRAASK